MKTNDGNVPKRLRIYFSIFTARCFGFASVSNLTWFILPSVNEISIYCISSAVAVTSRIVASPHAFHNEHASGKVDLYWSGSVPRQFFMGFFYLLVLWLLYLGTSSRWEGEQGRKNAPSQKRDRVSQLSAGWGLRYWALKEFVRSYLEIVNWILSLPLRQQ